MGKTSLHVVLLSAIFIAMSLLSASAPAYSGGSGRQKDEISRLTVQVVASIAHNPRNFTQGLLYHRGKLYESTGLVGQSSLQRIDAETGKVEKNMAVPRVFAEGLALFENRLVQLTWRDKTAFVYDFPSFAKIGAFKYRTEGWGLTDDGRRLIMSDGSDTLFFRNPFSFAIERKIPVTLQGVPLRRINELEYAAGKNLRQCLAGDIHRPNRPIGRHGGRCDRRPSSLFASIAAIGARYPEARRTERNRVQRRYQNVLSDRQELALDFRGGTGRKRKVRWTGNRIFGFPIQKTSRSFQWS